MFKKVNNYRMFYIIVINFNFFTKVCTSIKSVGEAFNVVSLAPWLVPEQLKKF